MSDQSEADQRLAKIRKKSICMWRFCFFSSLTGISAFLIGFVASRNWSLDSHGVPYLNSYGIGGATWGFLAGLGALSSLASALPETDAIPDGPSDHDLNSVFKDGIGIARVLKVLGLLGRIAVNAAFISYNFRTLPPRNPDERLNFSKYVVTWIEFPAVCLLGALALYYLAYLAARGRGLQIPALIGSLRWISSLSVLQSLPRANPMNALAKLKQNQWHGQLMVLYEILITLFFAPVAIMSLMVKISQIDFVTEESYTTWSIGEWMRLCAFVNNVASIIPPQDMLQITAVLAYVGNGDPHFAGRWMAVLCKGLVDTFGKQNGLVFAFTLTPLDVQKCLNAKNFDVEVVSNSAITAPNVVLDSETPTEPGANEV